MRKKKISAKLPKSKIVWHHELIVLVFYMANRLWHVCYMVFQLLFTPFAKSSIFFIQKIYFGFKMICPPINPKKMRCLGWNVKYVGSLFMRNNEGLNWKPDHVQISIVKFFGDWKWNGKMFNKNSKTFLQFTFLVSSQSCVLCKVVDRNSHIIIKSQKMIWCHLWNFQKLREIQLPDDGNPQLTLLKAHDSLLVSKTI